MSTATTTVDVGREPELLGLSVERRSGGQGMRRRTLIAGCALLGAAPLIARAAKAADASIAERFAAASRTWRSSTCGERCG